MIKNLCYISNLAIGNYLVDVLVWLRRDQLLEYYTKRKSGEDALLESQFSYADEHETPECATVRILAVVVPMCQTNC